MIDVHRLPGTPTVNDFLFAGHQRRAVRQRLEQSGRRLAVGRTHRRLPCVLAPGQDRADRITLIWADGVIGNAGCK